VNIFSAEDREEGKMLVEERSVRKEAVSSVWYTKIIHILMSNSMRMLFFQISPIQSAAGVERHFPSSLQSLHHFVF
jgi:hypothetical protein